jgi:hypothetical protein
MGTVVSLSGRKLRINVSCSAVFKVLRARGDCKITAGCAESIGKMQLQS